MQKNLIGEAIMTREFLGFVVTGEVSRLAIELAKQAGEEVQRPLSEAQLTRSLEALANEYQTIQGLLVQKINAWVKSDLTPVSATAEGGGEVGNG